MGVKPREIAFLIDSLEVVHAAAESNSSLRDCIFNWKAESKFEDHYVP